MALDTQRENKVYRLIRWNGRDLPDELRALPPGEYVIAPVQAGGPLSEAEAEGLEEALAEAERGETVDAGEVLPRRS